VVNLRATGELRGWSSYEFLDEGRLSLRDLEWKTVGTATIFVRVQKRVEVPAADGLIARFGHVV